jgi:hypothetical protein
MVSHSGREINPGTNTNDCKLAEIVLDYLYSTPWASEGGCDNPARPRVDDAPASPTTRVAMADETQATKIQSDVLWGAADIGREIGLDRQSTYHLLNKGLLPAHRLGRRWVSTKDLLRRAVVGERGG